MCVLSKSTHFLHDCSTTDFLKLHMESHCSSFCSSSASISAEHVWRLWCTTCKPQRFISKHTWDGHRFIPGFYSVFVVCMKLCRKVPKQVSPAVLLSACDLHEKFGSVVMQCFAHLSSQLLISWCSQIRNYSTAFYKEKRGVMNIK